MSFSPLSIPPSLTLLALSFSAQPFIHDSPVDLTVNQSSPATFSCTAQGNPVPTISWTGPSANFTTEDTPGSNFTVSSVLTIDSTVRALHEGVYTCSASNGVGPSPSSSATLTVQGTAGDTAQYSSRCALEAYSTKQVALHDPSRTTRPLYPLQSSHCKTHHTTSDTVDLPHLMSSTLYLSCTRHIANCCQNMLCFSSSSLSSPHCGSFPRKDCG